jgi:hypothetical protein
MAARLLARTLLMVAALTSGGCATIMLYDGPGLSQGTTGAEIIEASIGPDDTLFLEIRHYPPGSTGWYQTSRPIGHVLVPGRLRSVDPDEVPPSARPVIVDTRGVLAPWVRAGLREEEVVVWMDARGVHVYDSLGPPATDFVESPDYDEWSAGYTAFVVVATPVTVAWDVVTLPLQLILFTFIIPVA